MDKASIYWNECPKFNSSPEAKGAWRYFIILYKLEIYSAVSLTISIDSSYVSRTTSLKMTKFKLSKLCLLDYNSYSPSNCSLPKAGHATPLNNIESSLDSNQQTTCKANKMLL